ncbi:TauD/TfdA family dioxygenase [Streptomyces sp. NBC_00454]|uniref:TauD/TfdA family dioxygenase n=1 Tax=Streptomyces sp. NBC_00454 TaxID=2975747 RepID=UPI0030E1A29D
MNEYATGWQRRSFTGSAAFSLAYDPDHPRLAGQLRDRLLHGAGFALVTGVPVQEGTTADAQRLGESMLSPLGELLPQGRDTDRTLGWLVQDEGVSAYTDDRRFHESAYTSKSRGYLQLHNDRAVTPFGHEPDFIALLAHRRALRGGASVLVDGLTVHHILSEQHPRELGLLHSPFAFDRRHVTPPGQNPVVHGPVFEQMDGRLRLRCNTTRMRTAFELTGDQLTPDHRAALAALTQVLARPDLAITIELDEGDCLVIDDRRILHGRTTYQDHPEPARRRCLVRIMLKQHGTPPNA